MERSAKNDHRQKQRRIHHQRDPTERHKQNKQEKITKKEYIRSADRQERLKMLLQQTIAGIIDKKQK